MIKETLQQKRNTDTIQKKLPRNSNEKDTNKQRIRESHIIKKRRVKQNAE